MKWSAAIVLLWFLLPVATAEAQDEDQGEIEYKSRCSVCHGADAKGNGPWAAQLKKAPPDLTGLTKKNGCIFPRDTISEKIDGRKEVAAHGPRDMSVFGGAWIYTSPESKTRLQLLLDYLSRIQAFTISFSKEILPIFKERCVSCHHSPDGEGYRKSGLDLTSYEGVIAGTTSDQKVAAEYPYGKDAESKWKVWWLMWLVDWRGPNELRMPHGSDHQLSARERFEIRTWLEECAPNN
jgi:hypothetical protein